MSFLSGLSGSPHLGDKGVGNYGSSGADGVEILGFSRLYWDTAPLELLLSTVPPELESPSQLGKR